MIPTRLYGAFKPGQSALFLVVILILGGCSQPKITTSSPSTTQTSTLDANEPETKLLELPSWCAVEEAGDQVCFRCEREDGDIKIPYEQCLIPSPEFSATAHCSFNDALTKQISCSKTRSGQTFRMDASLAREKLAATLPSFLSVLDIAARKTFSETPDVAQLTTDLKDFWKNRIHLVLRGEGIDVVADDLVSLARRHLKAPLTAEQANHFRSTTITALRQLNSDLSGRKDYNLSQIILRGLSLVKSIPETTLGDDASKYFSGQAIAQLLAQNEASSLLSIFASMSPGVLGMSSVEEFLRELNQSTNN
jgi:hypothetical protein